MLIRHVYVHIIIIIDGYIMFENVILHVLIILIAVLILQLLNKIYFKGNSNTNEPKLFKDVGKRIKTLNLDANNTTTTPATINKDEASTNLKCDINTPRPCKISNKNVDCKNCLDELSACIHFENDEVIYNEIGDELGKISANKNLDDGYCLRILNKLGRDCTFKYGGRWSLIKSNDRFVYTCLCTMPSFFTAATAYTDCNVFRGCQNGRIDEKKDWQRVEDIGCVCNAGYKAGKRKIINSDGKESTVPICELLNVYERGQDDSGFDFAIETQFVDPAYKAYLGANITIRLPNPCILDSTTGIYNVSIGHVQLSPDNIAYCVSLDTRYVTVIYSDDYLLNNGGRYANALVRVSNEVALPGSIYETHTRRRKIPGVQQLRTPFYKTLVGRRYLYKDLLFKLPYMSRDSGNLNGPGIFYNFAGIIRPEDLDRAKIYIYNAEIPPTLPDPLTLGNSVVYVPVFTSSFHNYYKNYLGTLPYSDVPLLGCDQSNIINLVKSFNFFPHYSLNGIEQEVYNPTQDAQVYTRNYSMPIICRNPDGQPRLQLYTKLFTGIILTFKDTTNALFTKPISPGEFLAQRYRLQADKKWSSYRRKNKIRYLNAPLNLTTSPWNDYMFGEDSVGNDINAISMPHSHFARYTIVSKEQRKLQWAREF